MVLVHTTTSTAHATGKRVKHVTCAKCGMKFSYELSRTATGYGTTIYWIGQMQAMKRAQKAAQRNLAKRLDRECELVPCPNCHWIDQKAVNQFRRRMYRRAPALIIGILIVIFTAISLATELRDPKGFETQTPVLLYYICAAIFVAVPTCVLFVRWQLRRRFNPNVAYPNPPRILPGTPAAFAEFTDPQTGKTQLLSVATNSDEPASDTEWVTLRPGKVPWLKVCCVCLAPAVKVFRPPLLTDPGHYVAVPLCKRCSRRLLWRWWLKLLSIVGVLLLITSFAIDAVPRLDQFQRWLLITLIVVFPVLIAALAIAERTSRPYRLIVVDRDRGIFKFAARNPRYNALLAEQVRASERLSP